MGHPWESNWVLGDKIGHGGQGVTYLASRRDDPTQQGVLKKLKNQASKPQRARMRREVRALQELRTLNANVPSVLDHNTSTEDDTSELYVVMDFIPGETLNSLVESHTLNIDKACAVAISLCETLAIAHKAGILHRDLKPDNIIAKHKDSNDLVLVDFGLSFNKSDERITEANETFKNKFLDTPETNTPSGDHRDARTDVTAVCAILYYCLTGHPVGQLYDGTGIPIHKRPGFSVRDSIKDDLRVDQIETILIKGLAVDVVNRFQSPEELKEVVSRSISGPREVNHQDPISLAAFLSGKIQRSDRKTQIADLQSTVAELFQAVAQYSKKFQNALGKFSVAQRQDGFGGGGIGTEIKLPPGTDLIRKDANQFVVSSNHHQFSYARNYLVTYGTSRCFVMAVESDHTTAPRFGRETPTFEAREICSFESDSKVVVDLVCDSHKQWICDCLLRLDADIEASQKTSSAP